MLTSSIADTNGICFLSEPTFFEFDATLDASSPNFKVVASYFVFGQTEPFFRQNFSTSYDGKAKVFFNSILKANFNSTKELPEIVSTPELVALPKYKISVKETLLGTEAIEEIAEIKIINGTDPNIDLDIWTCGRFLTSPYRATSRNAVEYLYVYGSSNSYPLQATLYFDDQTTEIVNLPQVTVDGLTLIPADYNALNLSDFEVDKKIVSYQVRLGGALAADFTLSDVHTNFLMYKNRFGLLETMNFKFSEKKISKKQDTFDSEAGLEVTNLVFEQRYFCQSPPYFENKSLMIDFLKADTAFVFMENKFQKIVILTESASLEEDSPDFDPHFNFEFILSKQK